MKSVNPTKRRSRELGNQKRKAACAGKQIFLNKGAAYGVIADMRFRGETKFRRDGSYVDPTTIGVYKCKHCRLWHIGHAKPRLTG